MRGSFFARLLVDSSFSIGRASFSGKRVDCSVCVDTSLIGTGLILGSFEARIFDAILSDSSEYSLAKVGLLDED